jgi:hypothetical protein
MKNAVNTRSDVEEGTSHRMAIRMQLVCYM